MKKASITVFLALVLTLLFSFILTTLEAARIRGATAYTTMVADLAGESFLASYYYPLFQNYRLFGVNAGDDEGFFSEESVIENIRQDVMCGLEDQSGALLRFQNTDVNLLGYRTMLTEGEDEFLSQIRQQTVLDGTSLLLGEVFSKELLTEAGTVGEVYRRQEEALDATANVTKEVLRLMEQVDGIKMGSNGIAFDRNGRMQAKDAFVKQILPMEQRPVRESYGNEEVYLTVSDKFFRVDKAAGRVLDCLGKIAKLDRKIEESNRRISACRAELNYLGQQLEEERQRLSSEEQPDNTTLLAIQQAMSSVSAELQQEKESLKEYKAQRNSLLDTVKDDYNDITKKISGVLRTTEAALDIAETLEEKQQKAKRVVYTYEVFLEGKVVDMSEEICEVFTKELERMKLYAGLEEHGFSVETIRQSLTENYRLLAGFSFAGFSERQLGRIEREMEAVANGMKEYTAKGLWFTYGDIVVAEDTWENVMGALSELLSVGMLSLVGISKEEISECKVSKKELPSAGITETSLFEELTGCMEEVTGLLQEGLTEVLHGAGEAFLDGMAMELYSMKYFHSFGEESPFTKLKYEREYLIFGSEKDKSNLVTAVLHLTAIRTLLCMVMILKQPDRMAALDTLGAGVTGFTGMPVLGAVVKYAVLLLWAVEESLIEVSALLKGKRIAPVGTGMVAFSELFIINKALIARKAERLPTGFGATYSEYLALLSLTKRTRDKAYRAMDLIQENIRFRYNDGFRIRNVVTELEFAVQTETKVLFDTGIFRDKAYKINCREKRAY